MECLNRNSTHPCGGAVSLHPANGDRYNADGSAVMFPRCETHYDAYLTEYDERQERDRRARARQYCKHGTFIGDPFGADYLCNSCESGE